MYVNRYERLGTEIQKYFGHKVNKIVYVRLKTIKYYSVVEISGDSTPDYSELSKASILITTPEKWDGITRSHESFPRRYVCWIYFSLNPTAYVLGPWSWANDNWWNSFAWSRKRRCYRGHHYKASFSWFKNRSVHCIGDPYCFIFNMNSECLRIKMIARRREMTSRQIRIIGLSTALVFFVTMFTRNDIPLVTIRLMQAMWFVLNSIQILHMKYKTY